MLKYLEAQFSHRPWSTFGVIAGIIAMCTLSIANTLPSIVNWTILNVPRREVDPESWDCLPVPADFQVGDLVGTWQAGDNLIAQFDTLKLLADGTYQQTFVDHTLSYRYESQWNKWEVEYRPNGGIYLRLDGWKYCLLENPCMDPGDEEAGGEIGFYEPCEKRYLNSGSNFVLPVAGYNPRSGLPRSSRDIVLIHPRLPGAESSPATYTFLSETEP